MSASISSMALDTVLGMVDGIPTADQINAMSDGEYKVYENRIRRMAERRPGPDLSGGAALTSSPSARSGLTRRNSSFAGDAVAVTV